jgi:hypothetical protein
MESTVHGELNPAPQTALGCSATTSLSPFHQPFHPRERSRGRSNARRWAEDGLLDASDVEQASTVSLAPYLSTRLHHKKYGLL